MKNLKEILQLRSLVKKEKNLIHCITNPISINGCANIVLATGSKPIMAEHPLEVKDITKMSKALAVNLGNITDVRMESMLISGNTSKIEKIPSIIDLVGVGCSKLRLTFAKKYIKENHPNIIKGNMSEIKALLGIDSNAIGIDVGCKDKISEENLKKSIEIGKCLARKEDTVVVISGKIDIITDGNKTYTVSNGHQMLSDITGTGCMLNTLIASYMSSGNILDSAFLGVLMMTIAGEVSVNSKGTGSFIVNLLDNIYSLSDNEILEKADFNFIKE